MVGWHHRLNRYEFEQAPGVGDGQGSLACCGPWGRKESDTTEPLNNKILVTKVGHMVIRGLSSMLERTLYFSAKIRENVGQCD